ncbi:class I SAM-dependent methyltransferase [Erythrobacteraceae bacterium E2-1 Yellow Sea]|nr:class I SAM-dependent methyltransferase [Erythrobacteraceae bacterium E2-1 Yellow Sea]
MQGEECPAAPGRSCHSKTRGGYIDRSGMVGAIEIKRCETCGHGVSFPAIPDVAFLYEGRQSQDFQPDARNWLSKWIKDIAFRFQAKRLLKDIGSFEGRLLDFGCGSGQFTRVLDETADNLDVTGCDFFAEPPAELRYQSYIGHDELALAKDLYDGALAMHVLEHDDDTRALLDRITSPVKPGGLVVVEVPNVDCVWGDIFGRYWDAWYVPYHRHHFSQISLRAVLKAQGLKVEAIRGVTAPTMGRTLANLFGCKNSVFWIMVGITLHPLQLAGEVLTRRRTALRAVCRKIA